MLTSGPPPAHPPGPVVAGVHVAWPVAATATTAPGERLVVKVASKRRKVLVSLVRVSVDGRPLRIVSALTLRTGTFTAAPPAPGHYALRLSVANRRYWSWVEVPAPPAPAPIATPTPTPPPAAVDPCELPANGPARLVVSRKIVRPGEILEYRLANLRAGCFRSPRHYLQYLATPFVPSDWETVPGTDAAPADSTWDGNDLVQHIAVPADATPGQDAVRAETDGRIDGHSQGGSYVDTFQVTG